MIKRGNGKISERANVGRYYILTQIINILKILIIQRRQ